MITIAPGSFRNGGGANVRAPSGSVRIIPRKAPLETCPDPTPAVAIHRDRASVDFSDPPEAGTARRGKPAPVIWPAGFPILLAALALPSLMLGAAELTPDSLSTNRPALAGGHTNSPAAAAVSKLKFPGLAINLEERCVDVEASVCLRRGLLELVACTKGTKEHESIVVVEAKPRHIHAALLLLGAKPGSPATRQQLGDQAERWIDVPPRGGPVDVSLVLRGEGGKWAERPISDFIIRSRPKSADPEPKLPTLTFLFAGSVLHGDGPGPRRYLSDDSGNVISLSTFGDELLCLPAIHSQANDALQWQVNPTHLPAIGSNVTLRLRPQRLPAAKAAQANQSPAGNGNP